MKKRLVIYLLSSGLIGLTSLAQGKGQCEELERREIINTAPQYDRLSKQFLDTYIEAQPAYRRSKISEEYEAIRSKIETELTVSCPNMGCPVADIEVIAAKSIERTVANAVEERVGKKGFSTLNMKALTVYFAANVVNMIMVTYIIPPGAGSFAWGLVALPFIGGLGFAVDPLIQAFRAKIGRTSSTGQDKLLPHQERFVGYMRESQGRIQYVLGEGGAESGTLNNLRTGMLFALLPDTPREQAVRQVALVMLQYRQEHSLYKADNKWFAMQINNILKTKFSSPEMRADISAQIKTLDPETSDPKVAEFYQTLIEGWLKA